MNILNSDKSIPTRASSASPPPPLLPPRPPPRGPELRRASRAAGAAIFGDSDADGDEVDDDLPPSYEASTIRRPSDAHIHITVRSSHRPNTSSSSLPSLIAPRSGRTSINTQGYLLTTPMSHDASSRRRRRYYDGQGGGSGCIASESGGCCFSRRGGCFFSDRRGCCFSDGEGCCCSDTGGCCFSSGGGACCSDAGGTGCCSRFGGDGGSRGGGEMAGVETTMERNVRFA